jgi:hypothetical protein
MFFRQEKPTMTHRKLISVITTFSFLLLIATPQVCYGDPPDGNSSIGINLGTVATLQKGDVAPFTGTLLSPSAAAKLLTDLQFTEEQCKLKTDYQLSLLRTDLQLKIDMLQVKLDTQSSLNKDLISIKDKHIEYLQSAIEPPPWYESGEFWFTVGLVGGVLVTVAAGYAIGQAGN